MGMFAFPLSLSLSLSLSLCVCVQCLPECQSVLLAIRWVEHPKPDLGVIDSRCRTVNILLRHGPQYQSIVQLGLIQWAAVVVDAAVIERRSHGSANALFGVDGAGLIAAPARVVMPPCMYTYVCHVMYVIIAYRYAYVQPRLG